MHTLQLAALLGTRLQRYNEAENLYREIFDNIKKLNPSGRLNKAQKTLERYIFKFIYILP